MTRASRVTVKVPAAAPNRRTDAKTKVSETEMVAATEGCLMLIEPVSRVSPASTNHCEVTGRVYSEVMDCPIATRPSRNTVPMNN